MRPAVLRSQPGRDLPAAGVWLRLRDREPSGTIVADLGALGPDGRPIALL